ncbi:MAG TPA: radical SAM protein [Terriglobales bacterium]|jgi:radical SAM protein with 4Fe4S-binding SPASM domain|nr:radical SAM protein [Terriglobales bacterium]
MNSATYGEFSLALHQHIKNERAPLEVSLEVTRRCPLDCQHCYNNLAMGDLAARSRELTKEEYFSILTELADMGVVWLLFTGGEIFARKDFLEIYSFANRKGFLITLFTNGILINEKIADYLLQFPPFEIEITLYGRTRETYEKLTQLPGSFDRCMRGVRLLLDRGLPLKLKTVATSINRHEVAGMKAFAEQELGVEFKFDGMINPRIDCSSAPLAVRLAPEEVVALELHWPKIAAEHRRSIGKELASPPTPVNTVYSCGGGVTAFAIDPTGDMSICVLSHRDSYNVRHGSVREGWEQFLLKVRQRKARQISKCSNCRIRSACGMCPANGELENGDAESPVSFLCEVAHLRAMAAGFEVPEHGNCEFCAGGERHAEVVESARRIAASEVDPRDWTAPQDLLPILNNPAASQGCGSGCGQIH